MKTSRTVLMNWEGSLILEGGTDPKDDFEQSKEANKEDDAFEDEYDNDEEFNKGDGV